MRIFKSLASALLVFLSCVMSTHALQLGVEEAIEAVALKISFDEKTATGVIYGKVCDECDQLKLTITPETRAYDGNERVGIAQAKGRLGRYATVIFNKETNEVIRIQW